MMRLFAVDHGRSTRKTLSFAVNTLQFSDDGRIHSVASQPPAIFYLHCICSTKSLFTYKKVLHVIVDKRLKLKWL